MRKRLTKLNERASWRNRGACSRYPDHKSLPSALCEGVVGTTGNAAAPKYDLDERTAKFGETIIEFAKKLPRNPVTNRIIDQLVGAGTSIGANYCEADEAVSRKEFLNKIGTCKKEAKETKSFSSAWPPKQCRPSKTTRDASGAKQRNSISSLRRSSGAEEGVVVEECPITQ